MSTIFCSEGQGTPNATRSRTLSRLSDSVSRLVQTFIYATINFLGEYDLSGEKLQKSVGIQPPNAIISSPVPIDFRACVALKQSPLATDCYTWLCFEAYKASKSKKNRFVPFASLFKQMGGEYANQKEFTRNFKKAIKKALALAPNIHLEFIKGGLVVISDSLPPINANRTSS